MRPHAGSLAFPFPHLQPVPDRDGALDPHPCGLTVSTQEATAASTLAATQPPASATDTQVFPSPDGRWSAILDTQTGSLDLQNTHSVQGAGQSLSVGRSAVTSVIWSPDSRHLAFASLSQPAALEPAEPANGAEIWQVVIQGEQAGQAQLLYRPTGAVGQAGLPEQITLGKWSPDDRRLSFWVGPLSGSLLADGLPLWSLEVASGGATPVADTSLVNPAYQSWSPDGGALAFTNGGYRSAQVDKWLSLFQAATGKTTTLAPQEKLVPGAVAWSPQGGPIAFAAVEASKTGPDWADWMGWDNPAIQARRIYLIDPHSGEYHRLNATEAYQDAPAWSADGKTLYFVQMEGSQASVMSADPASGAAQALPGCQAPLPSAAGYYGQVDWSSLLKGCTAANLARGS